MFLLLLIFFLSLDDYSPGLASLVTLSSPAAERGNFVFLFLSNLYSLVTKPLSQL